MSCLRILPVVCVLSASLLGQQVSGPVLGYVWDGRIHRVRPLLGTPGAPSAGAPLATGQPIAQAAIAGEQGFAVVLAGEARQAALLLPESNASLNPLAGVNAGAERIELSPQGSAAAFYFPADKLIQVVSGLPGRPSEPVNVSLLPLRNPMAGFTVSDDGKIVLCREAAGGPDSDAPAAVVLNATGDLNRMVLSGAVTAAAFLEGTHDALLASGHELVLVHDVVAGVRQALPGSPMTPTTLAFAPGGQRAILADARTGWVAVEDLSANEAPVVLECHCHPTGLDRLNGEAAWRLTDYSERILRLVDLEGGTPRMLAVPPRNEPQ